jgi:PAS domain S-box-containing protein
MSETESPAPPEVQPDPPIRTGENRVLRIILEGTAGKTGSAFFRALVRAVAEALEVHGAWVTEFTEDGESLRALAFWLGDRFVEDFQYTVAGTPCADVIRNRELIHIPDHVVDRYPDDADLAEAGAVAYMSAPLLDTDGSVLGNLALIHDAPLEQDARTLAVFRIFAARAAAELRRLRAESEVREREEELSLLVDSAMDGIVELDADLAVARANRAAARVFRASEERLVGEGLRRFLSRTSRARLRGLMEELDARPEDQRSLWISGGLEGLRSNGETFPAEATLSRFEMGGRPRYTLILRDVDARREAERRLRHLTAETEYLREELRSAENFGEIVGRSEPLVRTLRDVQRVAETDATVLILGETGTGKELIARAIHAASDRKDASLVRVNCAAVPTTLIESEFFGHEKGAFTGATRRRDGRFALADGGTIFLDEVGELPLELQAKLLRVIQEGEFEPVGGERTRKVDVRVVAATNRYLEAAVRAGDFREDLYYRLNVFPIVVPPLRERGDDVVLLARTFLDRFARRMGREVQPLTEADRERLRAYPWPGNVRELQNVMERAVITARRGRIDLARVLPDAAPTVPAAAGLGADRAGDPARDGADPTRDDEATAPTARVLSDAEMKALERANIVRALEATSWQVSGENGAARLLGIPPSTLSSRMRSLEIERPSG